MLIAISHLSGRGQMTASAWTLPAFERDNGTRWDERGILAGPARMRQADLRAERMRPENAMPLIVDHEERRVQVARIAATLILRNGVDGVSVRAIAKAAGYSTAIVSHYFRDKAELLLLVYRIRLTEAGARVERALDGGEDMLSTLAYLLPLDQAGRDNWKIWFAFWGMALANPEFQQEQIEQGRAAETLIARVLARHGVGGEGSAGRVLAMIAGLATQATYDPDAWPPSRQQALLAAEIASIRSG